MNKAILDMFDGLLHCDSIVLYKSQLGESSVFDFFITHSGIESLMSFSMDKIGKIQQLVLIPLVSDVFGGEGRQNSCFEVVPKSQFSDLIDYLRGELND